MIVNLKKETTLHHFHWLLRKHSVSKTNAVIDIPRSRTNCGLCISAVITYTGKRSTTIGDFSNTCARVLACLVSSLI